MPWCSIINIVVLLVCGYHAGECAEAGDYGRLGMWVALGCLTLLLLARILRRDVPPRDDA